MKKNSGADVGQEEIFRYINDKAQSLRDAHGRSRSRNTSTAVARNELFLQELDTIFRNNPFPAIKPYKPRKHQKTERILNIVLSDLHYGADLEESETGHRYGPIEEARRTAAVILQAAEYKRQYRDQTILYVHLLGDIIQGKLHDPEDAAPMTEQYYRSVWNLGQALQFLCKEFKEVVVRCTPGNHGRRKDRHPDRAVNQKWDSIETMIYGGLQFGLRDVKNLRIETFLKPYYIYDAFGNRGFMTHGDTVLKPGYPGRTINIESMRKQINELNTGLGDQHCQLFGVGHVHVASTTRLPNQVLFLTNGCLLPSDEYAQSIGIFSTACCQQIWESVPGYIFGDRRDAIVDSNTDKNKELDRIVKPFPGMVGISKSFGK